MMGREDSDERPTEVKPSSRSSWGLSMNSPDSDEEKTTMISPEITRQKAKAGVQKPLDDDDADEGRTRILKAPNAPGPVDMSRLPVGWVAVVSGPGFGQAFPLFYGSNRVGRGANVEVALNFGDESISRGPHARITYDAKGRRFYVQPGEGTGLTYRDGEPVLTPAVLEAHTQIEIGHTVLRFLPLCTADFDWQDLPAAKGGNK